MLSKERVPVQVDLLQFTEPWKADGDAGESVVREADVMELLQGGDGGGKSFQLVKAQVERVEFPQEAELAGEGCQTVVTQVQNQQVLEAADGLRELLQLQQKQWHIL